MADKPLSILATSGDYNLNITSETSALFREVLHRFLNATECEMVILIERSGAVIVSEENEKAKAGLPRTDSLGVLAAGLYGATQMMAGQLEDENAPEVFCHGSQQHIYLTPVSEEFALVTVFREGVAVGIVRLNARKAAMELVDNLGQVVKNKTTYAPATGNVEESGDDEGPFSRYN